MNEQPKSVTDDRRRPLPIGRSDWAEIAKNDYCVDKTLMIKDLVDAHAAVALFTRPRRFGKTTAMMMLKTFFEKVPGNPLGHLFHDKQIWAAGEKYRALQGEFPVIYLTFKDHKARNWEDAKSALVKTVGRECARHRIARRLRCRDPKSQEQLFAVAEQRAGINDVAEALGLLAEALDTSDVVVDEATGAYGRKPIILIDEYDSPINSAATYGYYDEMVAFMRTFLSGAMKDNVHVEMGVMTGVLRVAKEGILSGLNNLMVNTVFDEEFNSAFGFTLEETKALCAYYGVPEKMAEVEAWYDGYNFGGRQIFNPWSVLNYFARNCKPQAYWLDTSSNDLINELVRNLPHDMAETLEGLMVLDTEGVGVPMTEELGPYQFIRDTPETLYALLVSTGYLKVCSPIEDGVCVVKIPNREIRQVFVADIRSKLRAHYSRGAETRLSTAFVRRDAGAFKDAIAQFLLDSVSYFDTAAEGFYHGMLLGYLAIMDGKYRVVSNRESGFGRFDIALFPILENFPGVIIEVKAADSDETDLAALAATARSQIDEKSYAAGMLAQGVKEILKFGLAFRGKRLECKM